MATRKALKPSQMRLSADAGVNLPPRLMRIQDLPWLECYSQQLRVENKSENTRRNYFCGLKGLIETPLPGENILSQDDYEQMTVLELAERLEPLNGRLDRWTHGLSELSSSSFNARFAAAKHMMKWLGHIWPDHLNRVRQSKKLPRTLTRRELTSVIEASRCSENPVASILVTILLDTGMRVSEVCSLNITDVDLEDASAHVIEGKGDKDRRVLFTSRTIERIQAWLPIRREIIQDGEQAFLLNSMGRRLQPRAVQRLMDDLATQAGLPKGKLTPHVLRHNFATGFLERGAELVTIQRLLGHSSIATTRVYLEISDQTLREVYHRAQASRELMEKNMAEITEVEELTPTASTVGIE